jgi:hypothetical protein
MYVLYPTPFSNINLTALLGMALFAHVVHLRLNLQISATRVSSGAIVNTLFPLLFRTVLLMRVSIVGMGEKFRHAGFTSDEPANIVPAELYCGRE